MSALSITGADLVRVLTQAMLPRVDAAVRARAERLAREAAGDGVVTRVWRRGAGEYAVEVGRGAPSLVPHGKSAVTRSQPPP